MRDYAKLTKVLRYCSTHDCIYDDEIVHDCEARNCDIAPRECDTCNKILQWQAADAIEELKDQIADVSKMICDLIAYAQKNADESREAEQRHYGSDSTVNVYTWMHNVKCVHERYVAMLDDIATKLPEPPKGVE